MITTTDPAPTLEEVWRLFRESERRWQRFLEAEEQRRQEARQAEEQRLQEARQAEEQRRQEARQAEEQRRQEAKQAEEQRRQEEERRRQEEEQRSREEEAVRRRETESRMRQMEEAAARTERLVGDLTGKWGKFVEGMVAPACETLFAARGIPVHKVSQRVRGRLDDGRQMEVDIMVVNGRHVVLVEVKSTLKVQDVEDHLERLAGFKAFFPEYAERDVLGAVAGMVIEEEADRYAYRKGLFVIAQRGESVALLNDERFRPRAW